MTDSSRDVAIARTPSVGLAGAWGLGIFVVALGAMVPFWTSEMPFVLTLASHAVIAALLALSLDMLTGNLGLLSFGHAAWYGFGAYVTGLVAKHGTGEITLLIPLTLVVTAIVAGVIGYILVKNVGKTFAILTLALSQIFYAIVFVAADFTGGEDGLQGIPYPSLFGISIIELKVWYWLLYTVLILALLLALQLRRSPLGRAWLAIRENPERAAFIGMNVRQLKLYSYVVSALLAALAGSFYVLFNGATSPETLHWFESGKILMYVVLGGVGTLVGPVFGGITFTFAEHYASSYSDAWLIYFGGMFVFIVIVAPGGIFGVGRSIWRRLERTGNGGSL